MSDVQLWRYVVPNINGSGWAIFVLGSDGYFSSISDFGNFAFFWRAHGCKDFREFFLKVEREHDYFIGKLSPGREYDGTATRKAINTKLHKMMEDGDLDIADVNEEASLLDLEYDIESSEYEFANWANDTERVDTAEASGLAVHRHPYMVERFVKEAMVRLVPLLKKDLEACSTSSIDAPAVG